MGGESSGSNFCHGKSSQVRINNGESYDVKCWCFYSWAGSEAAQPDVASSSCICALTICLISCWRPPWSRFHCNWCCFTIYACTYEKTRKLKFDRPKCSLPPATGKLSLVISTPSNDETQYACDSGSWWAIHFWHSTGKKNIKQKRLTIHTMWLCSKAETIRKCEINGHEMKTLSPHCMLAKS